MGFIHSAFFTYGLPLVSLPLIIHLLNRRRFKPLRWGAMEFLLKAQLKNRRRVRVENLLLLLLRTLLILLIVLFISRPLAQGGVLAMLPGAGESIERIVIIDDSASLEQKLGRQTLFERSRESLATFCRELAERRSSDQLTIIRTSRPEVPELVREPPASQTMRELAIRMLEWTTVDRPADLVSAIRTTVSGAAAADSKNRQGRSQRRILYILSDLRRIDWLGPNQVHANAIAKELRAFQGESEAVILFVDIASTEVANVGVTDLRCLDRIVVTEVPVRLEAKIKNFGTAPARDLQLMLRVGEVVVPTERIDLLAPGEEKSIKLQHIFRSTGVNAVTTKILGEENRRDGLERDDERHLSVEVLEAIRVLIVDGEPSQESFAGEGAFLLRALAPPGDILSGVTTKLIREDDLIDEDITEHHVLLAANLESWPTERKLALKSFVENGGGLALFVGDRFDAGRWMRELWEGGKGLLPCPLGEVEGSGTAEQPFRFAASDLSHPLTRFFQGQDNPFLSQIRFWNRLAIPRFDPDALGKLDEERKPVVVMTFDDDKHSPAIVERSYGHGRVVLFNLSADKEWNNWPTGQQGISYVVFMQELVRFLAPSAAAERNLKAGEPISRAINPARLETTARLRAPGYPKVPEIQLFAQRRDASPLQWLKAEDTRRAGLYELLLRLKQPGEAGPDLREPYAVNLIAEEGDLRRVDRGGLQASLPEVRFQLAGLVDKSLYDLTEGQRKELWKTAIMLFFIILAAEGALALYAGHHRAAAVGAEEEE